MSEYYSLDYQTKTREILLAVEKTLIEARKKHGPRAFNSFHEAYAVILEEIDELWDEVRKSIHEPEKIKTEALQSAAMLVRLLVEMVK